MSTTAFSGKNGSFKKATTVIEIKNWKVKVESVVGSYASNMTSGWEDQVDGIHKWSGTVQMFAVLGAPPCAQGEVFSASLIEGDETTPGGGSVIVESIEESVDIEDTKPVMFDVTFKGKGAWTPPAV